MTQKPRGMLTEADLKADPELRKVLEQKLGRALLIDEPPKKKEPVKKPERKPAKAKATVKPTAPKPVRTKADATGEFAVWLSVLLVFAGLIALFYSLI